MIEDKNIEIEPAWEFNVPAPVAGMAFSTTSGKTLIAAMDGTCYLLNPDGDLDDTISVEGNVQMVRVSDNGECFGVLTEPGGLYGFDPDGNALWEMDVEGASLFDLGQSGRKVALAVPPYAVLVAETDNPDEAADLTFQHEVDSLALVESDGDGVVAAGELGELSRVDINGDVLWKYNVGSENRALHLSHAAELVVLPVLEEGVQTFSFGGEGRGAFDLGAPVTSASAAMAGDGPLLALVTDEKTLTIMDMEGLILWEHEHDVLLVDFDFADDASQLVAVGGNQVALGFKLVGAALEAPPMPEEPVAPEEPSLAEEPAPPDESEAPVAEEEEEAEFEPAPPPGAPRPKGAVILGQVERSGQKLPTDLDQIFVTPSGEYAVAVLPEGEVLVLNRTGEVLQELDVDPETSIVKRRNDDKTVVWNPDLALTIVLKSGESNELPLGPPPARLFQCTTDGRLMTLVDEKDDLVVLRSNGEEMGRRSISPSPTHLYMSPGGNTILTKDGEGRFRFLDNRARQQRKQRIAGGGSYDHVILEEGFCALGGSEGRVIVHEKSGKVLWTERVASQVVRLESLENAIGVYDESGQCMVLNPYGEVEMEFEPPPGLSMLRWPSGGDPLLLHARRNVLTAYGGYSRKLDARWSFRCDENIRVFEADRNATFVVIAAGESLYCVEGPRE